MSRRARCIQQRYRSRNIILTAAMYSNTACRRREIFMLLLFLSTCKQRPALITRHEYNIIMTIVYDISCTRRRGESRISYYSIDLFMVFECVLYITGICIKLGFNNSNRYGDIENRN